MKVAITNIYGNVIYDKKDPRGLQITFFKKMLEESGCEVELVGKKTRQYTFMRDILQWGSIVLSHKTIVPPDVPTLTCQCNTMQRETGCRELTMS